MLFHKLFSTTLGIGYIGKGGGSLAALFCCICWYFAWAGSYPPIVLSAVITLFLTLIGVWSASVVEKIWGEDPSRVVIDEVSGMCVSLLFIPVEIKYIICAFILFRFFDIVKPFFIRKMEAIPSGLGIMMDDILAGIYSNLILQVIIFVRLF